MAVEITFACLPLRALGRFDPPLDSNKNEWDQWNRIHNALNKHGAFNTFYLHEGRCVFRFTNDDRIGLVAFRFEGTLFTDAGDLKTVGSDLQVELEGESCDWLTAAATKWLQETAERAVRVEFDRYIAAGDLQRTFERIEKMEGHIHASGGFLGMGL